MQFQYDITFRYRFSISVVKPPFLSQVVGHGGSYETIVLNADFKNTNSNDKINFTRAYIALLVIKCK